MDTNNTSKYTSQNVLPIGKHTNHILIIDDNSHIRSVLARHIMLVCRERCKNCALFHITEKAQSNLTFFDPIQSTNQELDFAIYESGSPRQSLKWIGEQSFNRVVIISDVMMPVDTEVGLDGLLDGLADLELPVSLLFVSSEAQSQALVQTLMAPYPANFMIKGGEYWTRLPEALVKNIDNVSFKTIKRRTSQRISNNNANINHNVVKTQVRPGQQQVMLQTQTKPAFSTTSYDRTQTVTNNRKSHLVRSKVSWWTRLINMILK